MDIKSRNIRYSIFTKAITVVLIWIWCMVMYGAFIFWGTNEIKLDKDFQSSYRFLNDYSRLIHNVTELNVKLKSIENIKSKSPNDTERSEQLARFGTITARLSNTVNFYYYIINRQTGEVYTDVANSDPIGFIKKLPTYVYFSQYKSENSQKIIYMGLNEDIQSMLSGTSYEIYTAIREPLIEGDEFFDNSNKFYHQKSVSIVLISLCIISTILALISFIYLIRVSGRREKGGELHLIFIDKLPADIHTLIVFLLAVVSLLSSYNIAVESYNMFNLSFVLIGIILSFDIIIGLTYIFSIIRQIKRKRLVKNSLSYKIYHCTRAIVSALFNSRVFKPMTILLLLAYGGISGCLFHLLASDLGGDVFKYLIVIMIASLNLFVVIFLGKSLFSLDLIMRSVKEISQGNVEYKMDHTKIPVSFSDFAKNIESIREGLDKAVSEAVKSERMKADLITNVSHDLKTPLTSIINYIDLLKKEDLQNNTATGYVNVLEEKSDRLKQLIDDLIEASKASSGNINVSTENVNFNELVMQACGEFEEKIKASKLDFRIDSSEKITSVLADGKHMWRIIENLISNVIKYSMPNSRVYINISKNGTKGIMTIKNISAFPLNISPAQLTERFVRGDASRTTEGSGLGLSIAQSLVHLQKGEMRIDIDGDLFKVTIELPLWTCKEDSNERIENHRIQNSEFKTL